MLAVVTDRDVAAHSWAAAPQLSWTWAGSERRSDHSFMWCLRASSKADSVKQMKVESFLINHQLCFAGKSKESKKTETKETSVHGVMQPCFMIQFLFGVLICLICGFWFFNGPNINFNIWLVLNQSYSTYRRFRSELLETFDNTTRAVANPEPEMLC